MRVGFAVVVVAGEVTVSATGVTCSAIALMCVKGLVRTMGQCGPIVAPLQRFCASLTILYHPWQLSASPPEKRPLSVHNTRGAILLAECARKLNLEINVEFVGGLEVFAHHAHGIASQPQ